MQMSASPNLRSGSSRAAEVQCHWLTWGKLLAGSRQDGPVVERCEHAVTRISEGFPEDLVRFCTLPRLFGRVMSAANAIQMDAKRSGAFVYRPVICAEGAFAVFARVQSLSEGNGRESRNHDQLSVLALDVRDWRPEVIPSIVEALLDGPYANRDLSSDTGRHGCARPWIAVADLQPECGMRAAEGPDGEEQGLSLVVTSVLEGARVIAQLLADAGNSGRVLAGLPWALGISGAVNGPGSGYAMRSHPGPIPEVVHEVSGHSLERAVALSDWVSFANLIGPEDEPCWSKERLKPTNRPVPKRTRALFSPFAGDFVLPYPFQWVSFADLFMVYCRIDEAQFGRQDASDLCGPDFVADIEALVLDDDFIKTVVGKFEELRQDCLARGEALPRMSRVPILGAAMRLAEILSELAEADPGSR